MRPPAPRAARRGRVRGLGVRPRGGGAAARARRDRARARQRARPRRPDDRRLLTLDAGLDRRRRAVRDPRLLDAQRGPGADAVVRRRRRRVGPRGCGSSATSSGPRWRSCSSTPGRSTSSLSPPRGSRMGDELHMRSQATRNLLIRELAPAFAAIGGEASARFIAGNHHFFLNLTMAAAKCASLAASGTEGSSIVSLISRNGTEVGIQLAGLPDRWFTAPAAPVQDVLLRDGHGEDDAALDIGDSAVLECIGLGGMALAAAPALAAFFGGDAGRPRGARTELMAQICAARSTRFTIARAAGLPSGSTPAWSSSSRSLLRSRPASCMPARAPARSAPASPTSRSSRSGPRWRRSTPRSRDRRRDPAGPGRRARALRRPDPGRWRSRSTRGGYVRLGRRSVGAAGAGAGAARPAVGAGARDCARCGGCARRAHRRRRSRSATSGSTWVARGWTAPWHRCRCTARGSSPWTPRSPSASRRPPSWPTRCGEGAVGGLAGLGPGLTPAGDDVLAGYAAWRHADGAPVALGGERCSPARPRVPALRRAR